jgi:hypothetical protein
VDTSLAPKISVGFDSLCLHSLNQYIAACILGRENRVSNGEVRGCNGVSSNGKARGC